MRVGYTGILKHSFGLIQTMFSKVDFFFLAFPHVLYLALHLRTICPAMFPVARGTAAEQREKLVRDLRETGYDGMQYVQKTKGVVHQDNDVLTQLRWRCLRLHVISYGIAARS
jgi:hypothetical protein